MLVHNVEHGNVFGPTQFYPRSNTYSSHQSNRPEAIPINAVTNDRRNPPLSAGLINNEEYFLNQANYVNSQDAGAFEYHQANQQHRNHRLSQRLSTSSGDVPQSLVWLASQADFIARQWSLLPPIINSTFLILSSPRFYYVLDFGYYFGQLWFILISISIISHGLAWYALHTFGLFIHDQISNELLNVYVVWISADISLRYP